MTLHNKGEQMTINIAKKRYGKYGDRVRIDVWILAAQYTELNRLAMAIGHKPTECMIEAIADWINKYKAKGV